MATLLKVRGLHRAATTVPDGSPTGGSYRGFRLKSAFTQKMGGTVAAVKGAKTSSGTTDNLFRITSKYAGTTFNGIGLTVGTPAGSGAIVVTAPVQSDGLPQITLAVPTTATANQVVAAINASPAASQWVTADIPSGTGAAVVVATAAGDLTGGTDGTGTTSEPIYLKASSLADVVVDLDDAATRKLLRRNAGSFVSLGTP